MTTVPPHSPSDAVVDVILPAYNGSQVIKSAIDSALGQEGVALRLIVVDDGSTDETAEVARAYGTRLTLVGQANRGVSGARNTGLGLARAPYVALLDQDDVWQPGKLRRQVELLDRHPEAGLVFTDMVLMESTGRLVEDGFLASTRPYAALAREPLGGSAYLLPWELADAVTRFNFISPSTVLLRRAAVTEAGGFDEAFRLCDDAECWLRVLRAWRGICIEERLVLSLVWEGNASLLRQAGLIRERIAIGEKVAAHPDLFPAKAPAYFRRERPLAFYRLGVLALEEGDGARARRHFRTSLQARPSVAAALALGSTFLGARARTRLREVKRRLGLRWAIKVK